MFKLFRLCSTEQDGKKIMNDKYERILKQAAMTRLLSWSSSGDTKKDMTNLRHEIRIGVPLSTGVKHYHFTNLPHMMGTYLHVPTQGQVNWVVWKKQYFSLSDWLFVTQLEQLVRSEHLKAAVVQLLDCNTGNNSNS
jgi:hypothetical protein